MPSFQPQESLLAVPVQSVADLVRCFGAFVPDFDDLVPEIAVNVNVGFRFVQKKCAGGRIVVGAR